jgi:hypothetical protein
MLGELPAGDVPGLVLVLSKDALVLFVYAIVRDSDRSEILITKK